MTRPDDVPEDVWAKAISIAKDGMCTPMGAPWSIDVAGVHIARAILAARAEQREEDARIAETADRPWSNTGSLIAAAIRNGGK